MEISLIIQERSSDWADESMGAYHWHMSYAKPPSNRQRLQTQADIRIPIQVAMPAEDVPTATRERIALLLAERYSQCRRTELRIAVEVYCRGSAKPLAFYRLPMSHVLMGCPTPGQARAAIKLIHRLCASINGKWLAEDGE